MSVTSYVVELRGELLRRGVADREVEQIVAEVRSHVAETGEEPVAVFGPAGVYAEAYAAPGVSVAPAPGPGDGIPTWAKVVLGMLAVLAVPFLAAAALVVAAAVTGGVTGVELLVVLILSLVVLLTGWGAVRAYRRRAGASAFGSWVVGACTVIVTGAAMAVAASALGSGGEPSPLVPHPAEVAFLCWPALVAAGVGVLVLRAAGRRH